MKYANISRKPQPIYKSAWTVAPTIGWIVEGESVELDEVYVYAPPLLFQQVTKDGFVIRHILVPIETNFASDGLIVTINPPVTLPPIPHPVPAQTPVTTPTPTPTPAPISTTYLVSVKPTLQLYQAPDGVTATEKVGYLSTVLAQSDDRFPGWLHVLSPKVGWARADGLTIKS